MSALQVLRIVLIGLVYVLAWVARISETFVAVHYGEVPERPGILTEVQAAWERIREAVAVEPRQRRCVPDSPATDAWPVTATGLFDTARNL